MSKLVAAFVRLRASREARKLAGAVARVADTQSEMLHKIIKSNRETDFGHDHQFATIKNVYDFRNRVPIRDYEGHRPYVDKIVAGEPRVLTSDPVLMFNLTSGTTKEPKLIPYTATVDRQNSEIMRQWLAGVARDCPSAFAGSFLGIVSPETEGTTGRVPFGSTSGRIYRRVPWAMRRHYAVPYDVFEIKDYDRRYLAILRFAVQHNVTLAASPNPSTFLRLADILQKNSGWLVKSLHDGKANKFDVPPQTLAKLVTDRRKAQHLTRVLEQKGNLELRDLWPNLHIVGCWLGGSVGLQLPKLKAAFPVATRFRDLGYLASEGRFNLPNRDNTPSGPLTATANFFEFVPEHQEMSSHTETLLADELEVGKRYYIIVTNSCGLYRYDINDIVEVTGYQASCPEIAFIRKGRDMTSITGEKLHLNHVLAAIRRLDSPEVVGQFRMWPDYEAARYVLAVEPGQHAGDQLAPRFWSKVLADFDHRLRQENLEYGSKRDSERLHTPILHLMKPGWANSEQAHAIRSGKRDVQFKWANLVSTPEHRDEGYIQKTIEAADDRS